MPRNKRLHFKDISALRALAFFPVYLFCIFFLINSSQTGPLYEVALVVGKIARGSFDFFFFLSAFLLTSHALREYKYLDRFSLKDFYIRRLLRISIVLLVGLIFAFALHPWLIGKLNLQPVITPAIEPYLLLVPNYFSSIADERLIYFMVICSVYLFLQFYFLWGIVMKFFKAHLWIVAALMIGIGITARIIHLSNNSDYILNTLAYGVPIGMGTIAATIIRQENWLFLRIKELSKSINIIVYILGGVFYLGGYLVAGNSYFSTLIPVFTGLFYAFIMIEQTFGKNSFIQLKSKKILTYLGKISYGMFMYQAIIGVLLMIAVESLDFDLTSFYVVSLIVIAGLIGTIITADLSYKLFEKPLIRIRREFKKV